MAARSKSYRPGRRGISAATMQNISSATRSTEWKFWRQKAIQSLLPSGEPWHTLTVKSLSVRRQPKKRFRSSPASTKKRIKGSLRSAVTIALIGSSLIGVMSNGPRVSPIRHRRFARVAALPSKKGASASSSRAAAGVHIPVLQGTAVVPPSDYRV